MGPKKKSKKQIEEEKALAEAQRKLEEELEKKRQEEEAERRRIEEEKRRVEEEKRRQEELVRLNEQAPLVADREVNMKDKRYMAKQSRKKDLDDKYLACDPLPDPEDEKDLNTFITLWKESKDATFKDAIDNCQMAENVIKGLNTILAEAIAQYDTQKIKSCQNYIKEIREITSEKFDHISAHVLTYIENYTKYTDEEIAAEREKSLNKKIDFSKKPEFTLRESTPDLSFGLFANVGAKSQSFPIAFDHFSQKLPHQQSACQLILRCLWTSYDYVSGEENKKKFDHYAVGGVSHCRMY